MAQTSIRTDVKKDSLKKGQFKMIGYLRGEVLEYSDGKMIVGIGGSGLLPGASVPSIQAMQGEPESGPLKGGCLVGYSVSVPQNGLYSAFHVGQIIDLYIYSHIREDAFDLYGFSSRMEKELFLILLGVNGIGPKSALGILSAVEVDSLIEAVTQGNQHFLTQIPGIGKKTAERMVVELRDVVRKKMESGVLKQSAFGQSKPSVNARKSGPLKTSEASLLSDAQAALLTLGYRETEIVPLLKRVLEESEPRYQRAEDLIKSALRQLA